MVINNNFNYNSYKINKNFSTIIKIIIKVKLCFWLLKSIIFIILKYKYNKLFLIMIIL